MKKKILNSLKIIFKYDKTYMALIIIRSCLLAISVFLSPYLLKVAIYGIENNYTLYNTLLSVLIILVLDIIINYISRVFTKLLFIKNEKIIIGLNKDISKSTLDCDFDQIELDYVQDSYEKAYENSSDNGSLLNLCESYSLILKSFISLIISIIIMFKTNIILVFVISIICVIKFFVKRYNDLRSYREFNEKTYDINRKIGYSSNLLTNLSLGKDLRIFNMYDFINKNREDNVKKLFDLRIENYKKNIFWRSILELLEFVSQIFIYLVLIYLVLDKYTQLNEYSFILATSITFSNSINDIIGQVIGINVNLNNSEHLYEFIFKIKNKNNIINDDSKFINKIEFKDVYYKYIESNDYTIKKVSFDFHKNEIIGLVGFNGAGKTTIVKLLCGLYSPSSGNILLDGKDIKNFDIKTHKYNFGPVFQEQTGLAMSIKENIILGEAFNQTRFDETLKYSDLIEKVNRLEEKENTQLTREFDENGIELSGGELQKLDIARALYKKPNFLILDEPTSSLDAISERRLYNNLLKLKRDCGILFISHRLSSARFCDKIIVLDKGEIIEIGSHKELYNKKGLYYQLFSKQSSYYKEKTDEKKS